MVSHVADSGLSDKKEPDVCTLFNYGASTGGDGGFLCKGNVYDIVTSSGLNVFKRLIEVAGLEEIFSCAGPFTLLVPTDAAFAAMDQELLGKLVNPSGRVLLQTLLLYHIVPGYIPSSAMVPGLLATVEGSPVDIATNPFTVNQGSVPYPDVDACNGIIHVIDIVLLPESVGKFIDDI